MMNYKHAFWNYTCNSCKQNFLQFKRFFEYFFTNAMFPSILQQMFYTKQSELLVVFFWYDSLQKSFLV